MTLSSRYQVIIRNDNHNTFDHVAHTLATHIPSLTNRTSQEFATRIDREGQLVVWSGSWGRAELYRRRLAAAGLTTAPIPLPPGMSTAEQERILKQLALRYPLPQHEQRPRFKLPRRFKFTRIGKIFTGITILVSIAAFNTGNNPLYLLFGMMLTLIVISGVLSETVIQQVEVQRQLPPRLFVDQVALISLIIENQKRRTPSFSLQIRERIQGLTEDQSPSVYVLRLDPKATTKALYQFAFPRRGLWRLQGVEIATSFPFELFRKGKEIVDPVDIVVYPRPATPPYIPTLGSNPQGSSSYSRPTPGLQGEFLGLRDYRPGDDVRNIHWKISAKRDQLITRELERPEAESITLCFYNAWPPYGSPHPYEPEDLDHHRQTLERGVELCTGLAQQLMNRGYPIALVTLDERTPFGSSPQHLDRILTQLATLIFHGDPAPPDGSDPLPWESPHFPLQPQDRCILLAAGSSFPTLGPAQAIARIPIF